jgi:hypothetical protein
VRFRLLRDKYRPPNIRAMAVLVVVLLITVFGIAAVNAYVSWRIRMELASEEASARLTKLRLLLRQLKQKDVSASSSNLLRAHQDDYMVGKNQQLLIAGLQTRLRDVVIRNRGQMLSARALAPFDRGELKFIGLRLSVSGTLKGVQKMLYEIETSHPYLFIEKASLKPLNQRRSAANESTAELSLMQMEFDVFGAIWPFEIGSRDARS